MKNLILFFSLTVLALGCTKENEIALPQTVTVLDGGSTIAIDDRDACQTGSCDWEIVAQGISPEFSRAVVVVQQFSGNTLVCQKTYEFAPPICNNCWQILPVNDGAKLRIFANVFTEGSINPNGKAYIYVRKAGAATAQYLSLPGGGTASVWINNVGCEPVMNMAAPVEKVSLKK